MTLLAAALAGGTVGVHHAVETDHLAAVTTMVEADAAYPGITGASWGLGHTVPIAALGLGAVLAGVRVPAAVTAAVEVVVGVVLVALGARLLVAVATGSPRGAGAIGRLSAGGGRVDGESFAVGALHGVAGSGALVVAVVSTAPSVDAALAFLAAFTAATVATMALVAAAWGRSLGTPLAGVVRSVAGVAGVAVGGWLVATAWTAPAPIF